MEQRKTKPLREKKVTRQEVSSWKNRRLNEKLIPSGKKICGRCSKIRLLRFFGVRTGRPGTYNALCVDCRRKISHTHYLNNKVKYQQRKKQSRFNKRKFLQALKNVPCKDCGKKYPYYVMDFDHARGKKEIWMSLGGVRDKKFRNANNVGMKTIVKEAEKCDVVCSNCHRERTFQRKYGKNLRKEPKGFRQGAK